MLLFDDNKLYPLALIFCAYILRLFLALISCAYSFALISRAYFLCLFFGLVLGEWAMVWIKNRICFLQNARVSYSFVHFANPGSHSTTAGKATKHPIVKASATKNGMTPRKTSCTEISF